MTEVSVTFAVGIEEATVVLPVDLPSGETILTGDIDAVVPAGTTARLRGNCRLINNLHVRGTLTADPTGVNLNGQGLYDIHSHDGGVLNLVGTEKTVWCRWGDTSVGWVTGDLLLVSPTAAGVFGVTAINWQGSWAATPRPVNSPDVLLPDGNIARPEVVNRSQTLTIRNVTRIMLHESEVENVHTLKWLRVLDSGKTGLTFYPIHFHKLYDTCRGSLVEGVYIENGKNHAFVVHGSHGVTLRDCVAYNTFGEAFWWDPPPEIDSTSNNSDDVLYDHCGAMRVQPMAGDPGYRLSGFLLGAGANLTIRDSFATCVQGTLDASGFGWPEFFHPPGPTVWTFQNNVAHNNKIDGIFAWQNDGEDHVIADYIGYRNGQSQIDHGAYENRYAYKRCILMGGSEGSFKLHAKGNIVLEDFVADTPLWIVKHRFDAGPAVVKVRRCQFPSVVYSETSGGDKASNIRYEDCGLVPADFSMGGAVLGSIAEIYEGGVLTHRWTQGVWT